MTLTDVTTNLDAARKEFEKAVADPTPGYALVGAGEFALAKLRSVRGQVGEVASSLPSRLDGAALSQVSEQVSARLHELQPPTRERLHQLPAQAQEAASGFVADAVRAYGELAVRGKAIVEKARGEEPPASTSGAPASTAASTTRRTAARKRTTPRKASTATSTAGRAGSTSASNRSRSRS